MSFSIHAGTKQKSEIVIGAGSLRKLSSFLEERALRPDSVIILADENTRKYCLPVLLQEVPRLRKADVITIRSGEQGKSIAAARQVWNRLISSAAGRDSRMICLGGGVVTDLGGFTASVFMRGIPFIHVPTSLMGQVDAAIGGKTALNLAGIKNAIGTFKLPEAVFIHPVFLETLPVQHLLSGFAEMLKCGLIRDEAFWRQLTKMTAGNVTGKEGSPVNWEPMVLKAIRIKQAIVQEDFGEQDTRRLLNFGHTIGHALESCFNKRMKTYLLHGHAVAAGMICATYLSGRLTGLSKAREEEIIARLGSYFIPVPVTELAQDSVIGLIRHDKKVRGGTAQFTLLEEPGKAVAGIPVPERLIRESLIFYRKKANPAPMEKRGRPRLYTV